MFVTSPVCCVSRASVLTGLYAHNHGTVNNTVRGNCASRSWRRNFENKRTFAYYLKAKTDYTTFYAGKYLNNYGHRAGGAGRLRVPVGWDWWTGLVGNSRYFDYTLSVNGTRVRSRGRKNDQYLTRVIGQKARLFLDQMDRQNSGKPFLMMLCPPAPHAPFTPERQYRKRFSKKNAPRTPNYGIHSQDKHWLVRSQPWPMDGGERGRIDAVYRNRWRTLLSVDDLVRDVVAQLRTQGALANTYVIYTSDNGYHNGQFSMPIDKRQPYEFDVRVPLLIRGPGISGGTITRHPVLNIDLAPTILELAGVHIPKSIDGRSIVPLFKSLANKPPPPAELFNDEVIVIDQPLIKKESHAVVGWRDHFLIEYWGEGAKDTSSPDQCKLLRRAGRGKQSGANFKEVSGGNHTDQPSADWPFACQDSRNNTYSCVRTLSSEPSAQVDTIYCRFHDDEHFTEFYDVARDPYQMNNTAPRLSLTQRRAMTKLLDKLVRCSGPTCP